MLGRVADLSSLNLSMSQLEQFQRRKAENEGRYRSRFRERWFGWWRNPPDRFAFLIALFTAGLFAATAGLWWATKDLVDDARSSGRAWLGPVDATMPLGVPQVGQPLKVVIGYTNTGKEPALYNGQLVAHVFSLSEWTSGFAASTIIATQTVCMNAPDIFRPMAKVAFPTTGFSTFQMTYDAGSSAITGENKILATEKLIAGDEIVALMGCFVYRTVNTIKHTSFCYFYQQNASDHQHLGFCTVGQDAD